jgi:hypothetical protein
MNKKREGKKENMHLIQKKVVMEEQRKKKDKT